MSLGSNSADKLFTKLSDMSPVLYVWVFLLTLLVCSIIHIWISKKDKLKDFPGPKGWPLVGNFLQLDPKDPHKTLTDWSKKYSDIFKIKLFKDDAIVLNDCESIKQMLKSEACSSRPFIYRTVEIVHKDMTDIVFHNFSPAWNENKKAVTRCLNAYGAGQMKIETITLECIDKLFEDILDDTNNYRHSIDIGPYIHMCTAGIITTLFYGRKLTDLELTELIESERKMMKLETVAGSIAILDHFSWMRHLPMKYIQECIEDAEIYRRWIVDRQMERQNDLIKSEKCILDELQRHVNKVTNKHVTSKELAGMTHNIISGIITTAATLYSLILVLINHPEIQEKMHEEIQRVTNGARPKVSDRSGMTYVKAVVEEILRYATNVPLGVPHCTSEDTVINGKQVPKGTMLLANIWRMHHDERNFAEPWKFKPERFLDESGHLVAKKDTASMPFGAGRRICPGEGLARNRTILIITSLLQMYRILPEDENDIPSCDPRGYDSGIVVTPFPPYKVKFMER